MVSNIFYFHPYLGKIPILTNIFQLGWNHQLERLLAWQTENIFFLDVFSDFFYSYSRIHLRILVDFQKWDRFQSQKRSNRDCDLRQEDSIGKAHTWDTQRESHGDRKGQKGRGSDSEAPVPRTRQCLVEWEAWLETMEKPSMVWFEFVWLLLRPIRSLVSSHRWRV